ncbi:MAG TPA: MGMT family protein, partial [Bacteroidia bacterium]|nr:MGMT family protein [Bacteroidia bacterium]
MTTSAFIDSPLGWIEIQCTEEAICMVSFRNERPISHEQTSVPDILQKCIGELKDFFNGKLRQFTVPVIQPGTDFQQRVWAELMKIPYGVTVSYLELSKRIGD